MFFFKQKTEYVMRISDWRSDVCSSDLLLITQWLASVTRRLRNNSYIYLAVVLSVLVLLDAGVFHVAENMRQQAFDLMVRNRVIVPEPDKDIIIRSAERRVGKACVCKCNSRWLREQ